MSGWATRSTPTAGPEQRSGNDTNGNLAPPPGFFHVVRRRHEKNTSEFVCVPRKLSLVSADGDDEDSSAPSSADGLHHSYMNVATSAPTAKDLKAQLVIVKMHNSTKALRRERDVLEALHNLKGSESFIGSWVWSEVIFSTPSSSYLCMRPIFGETLSSFGQDCRESSGIPTYFVWHILLGLMDALNFVHDAGIAHGSLSDTNTVLRCYAPHNGLQYRDYPDIVLTGFGATTDENGNAEFEDFFNLVLIMHSRVIMKWSDMSVLIEFLDMNVEHSDPLLRLAQALRAMIDAACNGQLEAEIKDLKKEWEGIASTERANGPASCPEWIRRSAYDDLASEEELEMAARPPTVLKFKTHLEKYRAWVRERRTPVALRKRTKTSQAASLLVLTFKEEEARDALEGLVEPVQMPYSEGREQVRGRRW